MSAAEDMTNALADLTAHHQVPPCGHDPELWMSEFRHERDQAAQACRHCPIIEACAALAHEVRPSFGTWGGHDYTPRPKAKR